MEENMADADHAPSEHERRQVRQARSRLLVDNFELLLRATLDTLSRKSDTAVPILYALKLWPALLRRRRH
jgi:hypothetical protein